MKNYIEDFTILQRTYLHRTIIFITSIHDLIRHRTVRQGMRRQADSSFKRDGG
jgi:hypothetical protein